MSAVRPATLTDLPWVKAMADRHKPELGFVLRPALAEAIQRGEVLVVYGEGFCHYHRRRDGGSTVYELCSEAFALRGVGGLGRALLAAVPRPVRLKCPIGLAANDFYAHVGGTLIRTEPGKRRALNVWEWPA